MAKGELARICDYPFTGARARERDEAEFSAGGMIEDRLCLLYVFDPKENRNKRVSQKTVRQLAQLDADVHDDNTLVLSREGRTEIEIPYDPDKEEKETQTLVNEYGEDTPVIDSGDRAAEWAERFSGIEGIRVGRKLRSWMLGFGRDPAVCKVAPFHIITTSTMRYVTKEIGTGIDYSDRFRFSFLFDIPEDEPKAENRWTRVRMGAYVLDMARLTERCPVPGNNQLTGEKMRDVPKIYPQLPRSLGGKAVLGVYMYPTNVKPGKIAVIRRKAEIEVVQMEL